MQTTRVTFRAERFGTFKGHVTAVLPDVPANPGNWVCYAHIGQHSECTQAWYYTTRPAKAKEYAPLLKELRRVYGAYPDPVKLDVVARISRKVRQ